MLTGMDLPKHGESAYPADAWVEQQYMKEDAFTAGVSSIVKAEAVNFFGVRPILPMITAILLGKPRLVI